MVRYSFINARVLNIYQQLESISFPIEPGIVFSAIHNCRVQTFSQFALKVGHSLSEVAEMCESKSACAFYDVCKNRYLVLYNDSPNNNNVPGRIRWSKAHELGHIDLGHLIYIQRLGILTSDMPLPGAIDFEKEADYFASLILAPFPLYKELNIQSPFDIKHRFGLSSQAANYRWNTYLRWNNSHRKTAWEDDLRRVYLTKAI